MTAAAALALENERLQAELRARLEDLRASRARLVHTGDEERRRLERNLHDGAQQRLVALSLSLRLAEAKLARDPDGARDLITAAAAEAANANEELRELARGLHPSILSDRGLGPALEALASRAPVPVEVDAAPDERLPRPVEVAAYYVVAEALTNVAKYARATLPRFASSATTDSRCSRSPTTASAAPTSPPARGSVVYATASRRSTGASPSRAPGARARSSEQSSPFG